MMGLPKPPNGPPRIFLLDRLAPLFAPAVQLILDDIKKERVYETVRTDARQAYLYGFGRLYDDGRGPVTGAPTALNGWHFYGLAVDIVEDDATPWVAPMTFWQSLGEAAERHGCTWGGRWKALDLPHVQWGGCPVSPTRAIIRLYTAHGIMAVWREVGAVPSE